MTPAKSAPASAPITIRRHHRSRAASKRGFPGDKLLVPTDQLSENELAAARLVIMTEYNPQNQPRIEWPAAFPVVRSYLDQLTRNNGISRERTTAVASALTQAERRRGMDRRAALEALARQVDADVAGARDQARVRAMAAAIRALAARTQ